MILVYRSRKKKGRSSSSSLLVGLFINSSKAVSEAMVVHSRVYGMVLFLGDDDVLGMKRL